MSFEALSGGAMKKALEPVSIPVLAVILGGRYQELAEIIKKIIRTKKQHSPAHDLHPSFPKNPGRRRGAS
ncbi:MAG: hypothetical protein ACUVXF_00660 [Desulfobaccales bacterium]